MAQISKSKPDSGLGFQVKALDTFQFHPGGNSGANLKSISHRCHPRRVAFERELTKQTICLLLGCLQGGCTGNIPTLAMMCRMRVIDNSEYGTHETLKARFWRWVKALQKTTQICI